MCVLNHLLRVYISAKFEVKLPLTQLAPPIIVIIITFIDIRENMFGMRTVNLTLFGYAAVAGMFHSVS